MSLGNSDVEGEENDGFCDEAFTTDWDIQMDLKKVLTGSDKQHGGQLYAGTP